MSDELSRNEQDLLSIIIRFEKELTPNNPAHSKIKPEIIGHGSTSIGFRIEGWEHLHIRRLPGFQSYAATKEHIFMINEYRRKLHSLDISTTQTQLIALEDPNGYGVVYVIQPFLGKKQLSKNMLETYGEPFKKLLLKKQMDVARKIIKHNNEKPTSAVTVDIVNNNWEIVDFDAETMNFDIRLNDIAQPLFKENNEMTYDFYDQAFSIIAPLSWLFVQPEIQEQFAELFDPNELLKQALWGYDIVEPMPLWRSLYLWLTGSPYPRAYPQWAMKMVNDTASEFGLTPLTPQEILSAHQEDKDGLVCMFLYRDASENLRRIFNLNSNVYMNPGKSVAEMYASDRKPSYVNCLWDVVSDAMIEGIYGPTKSR